jgi:hypothetical protein
MKYIEEVKILKLRRPFLGRSMVTIRRRIFIPYRISQVHSKIDFSVIKGGAMLEGAFKSTLNATRAV